MYNFNLIDDEKIIQVFEKEYVRQKNKEKNTTIAITNKRILFLDYVKDDPNEVLRIARGVDYVRYQEVYYKVNLSDIDSIDFDDGYNVRLIDGTEFAFDNEELFNLIINNMK